MTQKKDATTSAHRDEAIILLEWLTGVTAPYTLRSDSNKIVNVPVKTLRRIRDVLVALSRNSDD